MSPTPISSPGRVVRAMFAAATIVTGGLGFAFGIAELLVVSGTFAILWTVWEWIWDAIVAPFGDWIMHTLVQGGVSGAPAPNIRPTLDDTIRLLESHLDGEASQSVQIQSAIRLEEIYRTVKDDEVLAAEVRQRVSERFPEARELERWRTAPPSPPPETN